LLHRYIPSRKASERSEESLSSLSAEKVANFANLLDSLPAKEKSWANRIGRGKTGNFRAASES
jgi:hypothetical protein